jgi:ABC-type lipoprotein export system ATPase subunit
MVTHDPEVEQYAERIINIKDGKITKDHGSSKKYLWKAH